MEHSASQFTDLANRQMTALIAPPEHGAWGLLFVPLATGGALGVLRGGNGLPLMALAIAALALFWLRTPVESWLGTGLLRAQGKRERRSVGITILLLAAVASVALESLFSKGLNRGLMILGPIAVSAFLAQALLRKLGRRTRMLSQIVGTLALTVTAPAAYYVVMGSLDRMRAHCGWRTCCLPATRFILCSSAFAPPGPAVGRKNSRSDDVSLLDKYCWRRL